MSCPEPCRILIVSFVHAGRQIVGILFSFSGSVRKIIRWWKATIDITKPQSDRDASCNLGIVSWLFFAQGMFSLDAICHYEDQQLKILWLSGPAVHIVIIRTRWEYWEYQEQLIKLWLSGSAENIVIFRSSLEYREYQVQLGILWLSGPAVFIMIIRTSWEYCDYQDQLGMLWSSGSVEYVIIRIIWYIVIIRSSWEVCDYQD